MLIILSSQRSGFVFFGWVGGSWCFFFFADYVILFATEPDTQNPAWRALAPSHQEQTVFEERHLRYISLLGKVGLRSHTGCSRTSIISRVSWLKTFAGKLW